MSFKHLEPPKAGSPRRGLADQVYEPIREMLFDQNIEPGSRLNIEHLARQLDVSATPVREALSRLESDGLVTKYPARGYFATPLLDDAAFEELYDMRLTIEPAAAKWATTHIQRAELDEIRGCGEQMHKVLVGGTYQEYGEFARIDATFHRLIVVAARNRFLLDSFDRLRSHQQLSRLYTHHGVVDADEAVGEHDLMVQALQNFDADGAARVMSSHIQRSRNRLRGLLRSAPSTADLSGANSRNHNKRTPGVVIADLDVR